MKAKGKIILSSIALVLVVTLAIVAVFALTQTSTSSSFKVNFIGTRNVKATINAKSKLSNNDTIIETPTSVTFDGSSSDIATKTINFATEVTIPSTDVTADYIFEIYNNLTDDKSAELIVEPSVEENGLTNATITVYLQTDETADFTKFTGAYTYVTLAKNQAIRFKVSVKINDGVTTDVTIKDAKITFKLYTHTTAPSGYESSAINVTDSDIEILKKIESIEIDPTAGNNLEAGTTIKTYDINDRDMEEMAIVKDIYSGLKQIHARRFLCSRSEMINVFEDLKVETTETIRTSPNGNIVEVENYQLLTDISCFLFSNNGKIGYETTGSLGGIKIKSAAFEGKSANNMEVIICSVYFDTGRVSFCDVSNISGDMVSVPINSPGYVFAIGRVENAYFPKATYGVSPETSVSNAQFETRPEWTNKTLYVGSSHLANGSAPSFATTEKAKQLNVALQQKLGNDLNGINPKALYVELQKSFGTLGVNTNEAITPLGSTDTILLSQYKLASDVGTMYLCDIGGEDLYFPDDDGYAPTLTFEMQQPASIKLANINFAGADITTNDLLIVVVDPMMGALCVSKPTAIEGSTITFTTTQLGYIFAIRKI